MIGLDTNVLVRYLTQDDAAQAAKASRAIESAESSGLFISTLVACELVWVLQGPYDRNRAEIGQTIEKLLLTGQFEFQDRDLLWTALDDYRSGSGDLADYVIGRAAQRSGCTHTLTFDRALKKDPLFRLL